MTRPNPNFPPKDQMVMGLHSLRELLTHAPERILRVYTVKPSGERKSDILTDCTKRKIPIVFCSLNDLTQMTGSDSHQGFAAHVRQRKFLSVHDFLESVQ